MKVALFFRDGRTFDFFNIENVRAIRRGEPAEMSKSDFDGATLFYDEAEVDVVLVEEDDEDGP